MALLINKMSGFGVEATYWKVTRFQFIAQSQNIGTGNPIGIGVCSVEVSGWVNKAARDALYAPLQIKSIVTDEDYADKAALYTFLKTTPEFQDAIDELS